MYVLKIKLLPDTVAHAYKPSKRLRQKDHHN